MSMIDSAHKSSPSVSIHHEDATDLALAALSGDGSVDEFHDALEASLDPASLPPLENHNGNNTSQNHLLLHQTNQAKSFSHPSTSHPINHEGESKSEYSRSRTNSAAETYVSSDIVDILLDLSEEEQEEDEPIQKQPGIKSAEVLGLQKSPGGANNHHKPSSSQNTRGNGLRILDDTSSTTPISVPASDGLIYLSGKLTISKTGESYQLVLRGVWGFQRTPTYIPERFELVSNLPKDSDINVLPAKCIFSGFFVHKNRAMEENNVAFVFTATANSSALFTVKGSGTNQFGEFQLIGNATWLGTNDTLSYSLMLTKTYNDRKRSQSETNTNLSRPLNDLKSTDSTAEKMMNGTAAKNESVSNGSLEQNHNHTEEARKHQNWTKKRNRTTLLDQFHRVQYDNLQTPCMTWTIRDVAKPVFPKMAVDFLQSNGIIFINDLLKANSLDFYGRLMRNNGFRAACAMIAWRTNRSFRGVYKLSLAKQYIDQWKRVASRWWKNTLQKNWSCKEGLLSGILSLHESSFLETKCGITSTDQLLMTNQQYILDKLREANGFGFHTGLWEGMYYSWIMRAQENTNKRVAYPHNPVFHTLQESLSSPLGATYGYSHVELIQVNKRHKSELRHQQQLSNQSSTLSFTNRHSKHRQSYEQYENDATKSSFLKTPMQCLDFLFLRSQNITSDEQLSKIDVRLTTQKYCGFLETNRHKIPFVEANQVVTRWKIDALEILGKAFHSVQDTVPVCYSNRIDKSYQNLKVMCTVKNLSNSAMQNGLPTQTICAFDDAHDALYQFRVNIAQSRVSPMSGNGAFLTFEGCKVLKESSQWKKKVLSGIPPQPLTREPLTAVYTGGKGAAIVTLTGESIHGDEYFYGPEEGIGMFNEYTLDDFEDVENITFSSKNIGCCMIELDRYAPLLPQDRKPDLIFGMKDFIFSHEPSSWRFDVREELKTNGGASYKQVVDFTDDTTGSPHSVARSHVAMYVNEVAHDENLIENVCPLETPRSVYYYVFIDKPMKKGEEVELLVNYGEGYEECRVRRGYGKANTEGMGSDSDNFSRLQRNLRDRMLIEESILSCFEEDIHQILDFFEKRVWTGLSALNCGEEKPHILRRQSIARRRLHWLAHKFRVRLLQLSSCFDVADCDEGEKCSLFYVGMYIFVHGWIPDDDSRPPYTGIATIKSISRAKNNKYVFDVCTPGSQRIIPSIPEGAVTIPSEDDFAGMSSIVVRTWLKQKQEKRRVQLRAKLLPKLNNMFEWNASFIEQPATKIRENLIEDYRWEISEEILSLLARKKTVLDPFDKTKFCKMSQTLLQKVLHAVADFTLSNETNMQVLMNKILSLSAETANALRELTGPSSDRLRDICTLALHLNSTHDCNKSILIAKSIEHNVSVEEFIDKPQPLDTEWYICYQIVMVIHPLTSSIDWQIDGLNSLYSLRLLCERVGLDYNSPYLTFARECDTFTPIISLR